MAKRISAFLFIISLIFVNGCSMKNEIHQSSFISCSMSTNPIPSSSRIEGVTDSNNNKTSKEVEVASKYLMNYLHLKDNKLINYINYSINGKYVEFKYEYETYAVRIKDNSVLKWTRNPESSIGGPSYDYYKATCEVDGVVTKRYDKVYNKQFISKDGVKKEDEVAKYLIWLPEMKDHNLANQKINLVLKQYYKNLIDKYDAMAKKHINDDVVLQSIKLNDCIAAVNVYCIDVIYFVTRYDSEVISFKVSEYGLNDWNETITFSTKTGELISKNES